MQFEKPKNVVCERIVKLGGHVTEKSRSSTFSAVQSFSYAHISISILRRRPGQYISVLLVPDYLSSYHLYLLPQQAVSPKSDPCARFVPLVVIFLIVPVCQNNRVIFLFTLYFCFSRKLQLLPKQIGASLGIVCCWSSVDNTRLFIVYIGCL